MVGKHRRAVFVRLLPLLCSGGMLVQMQSCDTSQIVATTTTTTTIDPQQAVLQLLRGIILTPIDTFLANAVNEVFDNNE